MSIYIGNLAYEVQKDEIRQLFEAYGTVKTLRVPMNDKNGNNRGFAVVEMETDAEEVSAIQMLRGIKWMGRILKVNRARNY